MPLDHAILAFVTFQPQTGYDLKKYIDRSIGHFWSATQSHIYKSLDRMLAAGWLTVEVVAQDGTPDRKVYHVTPAGSTELRRWLTTPLPVKPTREDWLIQLFFAHGLSNEEIEALLRSRVEQLERGLERLRCEAQASLDSSHAQIGVERARDLWQMTLDYGLALYEAELTWLNQAVDKARRLSPLKPPRPQQP